MDREADHTQKDDTQKEAMPNDRAPQPESVFDDWAMI